MPNGIYRLIAGGGGELALRDRGPGGSRLLDGHGVALGERVGQADVQGAGGGVEHGLLDDGEVRADGGGRERGDRGYRGAREVERAGEVARDGAAPGGQVGHLDAEAGLDQPERARMVERARVLVAAGAER